jgi:hypothetical protein
MLEILIVVIIIGVMLVIIVPRGYRANVDAKYNMVRQAAAELGKWGVTWATRQLESQDPSIDCMLDDYMATLVGYTADPVKNWIDPVVVVPDCGGSPTVTVQGIMPLEQVPRNPFNGASYFVSTNFPATPAEISPGQLCLNRYNDATPPISATNPNQWYYYFLFLGTESTDVNNFYGTNPSATDKENIRTGVFVIRTTEWRP